MTDLATLYDAFRQIGEDPRTILTPETAHVVAYGHRLISQQSIPGMEIQAHADESGVHARVTVAEGRVINQPVHLCFGLFERFGIQNVDLDLRLEVNARASFWSHCLFMFPEMARHAMEARVAVADEAQARILGATEGNAAGARGHMDCLEIVRGQATASAVPEVRVSHPEAKVTHEAAIGSVDERQIEALMARGLAPEDAVDRIVLGMLA